MMASYVSEKSREMSKKILDKNRKIQISYGKNWEDFVYYDWYSGFSRISENTPTFTGGEE